MREPNKVEKAASAKVPIDEAITLAREKVSGTVIQAGLEQKHDRLIWEVEVVTPEKRVMEIHIDAHGRGRLLMWKKEKRSRSACRGGIDDLRHRFKIKSILGSSS